MRGSIRTLSAAGLLLSLSACDMTVTGAGGASEAARGDGTDTVPLAEYPERVFWGDTHLHTDNSIDAFGFGVRLGPEQALRFARGEKITATTGVPAQLDRPLDFLLIADHSDGLGATRRLYDAPRLLIRDATLRRWHDMMHEGPLQSQRAIAELITAASNGELPEALRDPENQAKATEEIWTRVFRDQLGAAWGCQAPGAGRRMATVAQRGGVRSAGDLSVLYVYIADLVVPNSLYKCVSVRGVNDLIADLLFRRVRY